MSLSKRIIETAKMVETYDENSYIGSANVCILRNQYQIMLNLQEILSRLEDLEDIDNDPDLRDPEFGPA